jgi:hypothetical protein
MYQLVESEAMQRQSIYQSMDSVKSVAGSQFVMSGTEEGPDMLLAMAMGQNSTVEDR